MPLIERSPAWVCLSIFSLVCLLAVHEEKNNRGGWGFEEKWSLAMTSISFALSTLASLAHSSGNARDRFVATKFEGIVISIIVFVWALALPVIMAPKNGLTMSNMSIVDANLYFGSWCAFGVAMYIFVNYGSASGHDPLNYFGKFWLSLFIANIVAMSAAVRIYSNINNDDGCENDRCKKTRLGIFLSAISAIVAFVIVCLSYMSRLSAKPALGAAVVVMAIWTALVAVLTFKRGPGSSVGNLFFFTWISFLLSLFLLMLHIDVSESDESHSESPRQKKKQEQPV